MANRLSENKGLRWGIAGLILSLLIGCSQFSSPSPNPSSETDSTSQLSQSPAAKGTYVTYSDQALVLGFNKGMQIFEVRSFDQKLQKISLAKTKEIYGTPAYDVKVNGEEIIGYTSGQEFKIELVFPEPTNCNPNPPLDHYLVLYPQGTVNSMANDPGRQW